MPGSSDELDQERARLQRYINAAQTATSATQTDFAYQELNSRFVTLQQQSVATGLSLGGETAEQKQARFLEEHEIRKKAIEKEWHEKTASGAGDLEKRGVAKTKKPDKAFYSGFSLKDLEVLAKNSDRGGNSQEYNDVVTDLELYNSVDQNVDESLPIQQLKRVEESCRKYLESRHPFSTKGKIRKAIIAQISEQAQKTLSDFRARIMSRADQSFAAFQQEQSPEKINAACREHFQLISRWLQGDLELSAEESRRLDNQMAAVLRVIKQDNPPVVPVDADQADTMSTRFFNALGWTDRKPELVSEAELDQTISQSTLDAKHKRKMFHTIEEKTGTPGITMARQLLGDGRHFLSEGISGRGTYLATSARQDDRSASEHCWSYGRTANSVQFSLCLNDKAKVFSKLQLMGLKRDLEEKIPGIMRVLAGSEKTTRRLNVNQESSMYIALAGYNTIFCPNDGGFGLNDYYVTGDRSVLTRSDSISVRTAAWEKSMPKDPLQMTKQTISRMRQ